MLEETDWKILESSAGTKILRSEITYFRNSILQNIPLDSIEVIKKFKNNGICDTYGNLTEKGLIVAISYLSLEEQCKILGIKFEYAPIISKGEPEINALKFYKNQGYEGCSSEGAIIGVILYCLCFKYIYPVEFRKYEDRFGGYLCFPKCSRATLYILINLIKNGNEKIIKKNFNKIFKRQYYYYGKLWISQGIDEDLVIKIYNYLGNEEFINIGRLFFSNPNLYFKGWPDLIILKNDRVRFIEVKTNDKLRRSQIITIGDFKKSTSLDISVLRII